MKLTTADLRKLRLPMLITLALLAIAVALAWRSSLSASKVFQEKFAAESRTASLEKRLATARSEEHEIKVRSEQLQRLEQSAIGSGEKRLIWTELLQDLQKSLRIPGMSYEFGVQKPLDEKFAGRPGFSFSPMRLQLNLLHEGDLLNFLTRLQSQAPALVLVRRCKLATATKSEDAPFQLQADCELNWVTMQRFEGGK